MRSEQGRALKGLYVELQYRTLVQHAWATAVEVIGFITESQPKFKIGDTRYVKAMALSSEILARAHEGMKGPHQNLDDRTLVKNFLQLDRRLRLLDTLRGLNEADEAVSERKNVILILSSEGELDLETYRDAPEALRALFRLEQEHPDRDIVLVRADTTAEMRLAFKNYFSDARDFIRLVEEGCAALSRGPRATVV